MKEIFVGTVKGVLFIVIVLIIFWILNSFDVLPDDMIAFQLTVSFILFVFIEREENKRHGSKGK